ncbi:DUF4168 domain-containing protein [Marinimicrobium sp. LS-A18]|uniref:DUF4168 domain-containing protein n=1 Tax=Marinimicrobium sp. LS-A18 TaxID=1381596 RepID=UPI000467EA22|nr:DUF4168 domain-containing protein [Marinimicrobium sp. LS-A18]
MRTIKHPVLALLASVGLLFGAATVSAQDEAQAPQAQPQTQVMDVSEDQVESFVDAYMAVQGINQEYTQKLQAVEDPEKATELQQEAQTKMQEAVSDSGLSISEYQQIANQAGQSEELRSQIEAELTARIEQDS